MHGPGIEVGRGKGIYRRWPVVTYMYVMVTPARHTLLREAQAAR